MDLSKLSPLYFIFYFKDILDSEFVPLKTQNINDNDYVKVTEQI